MPYKFKIDKISLYFSISFKTLAASGPILFRLSPSYELKSTLVILSCYVISGIATKAPSGVSKLLLKSICTIFVLFYIECKIFKIP